MSTAPETVRSRLAVGLRLDSLWAESMGIDPSDTKERPLRLVADLLNRAGVSYALITGVALMEKYPGLRTPETLARLRGRKKATVTFFIAALFCR